MKQATTDPAPITPSMETLALRLAAGQLNAFFPLLQKGVTVTALVGCPLRSLLCEQFAIPADYVTERITTIFLDNRPVDDLDRTIVQDGSRVTLSAAMPGLVGATMRRGGFYAAFREGISYSGESGTNGIQRGTVRLKLFNLLLGELGPLVLGRGLLLERDELARFLQNLPPKSRLGTVGRTINAAGADREVASSPVSTSSDRILLTVTFRE